MKKVIALVLALGLLFCAAPAFAANQTDGRSEVVFAYEGPANPTYTISIPARIDLMEEGSDIEISVSDVDDLEDKKISVTVAGSSLQETAFLLSGTSPGGDYRTLPFDVTTASGALLAGGFSHRGAELVSFTEDGADTFFAKPKINASTTPDTTFTGSLVYGIAVID